MKNLPGKVLPPADWPAPPGSSLTRGQEQTQSELHRRGGRAFEREFHIGPTRTEIAIGVVTSIIVLGCLAASPWLITWLAQP